jgi:predicted RNA-binding protein with PUA-like domain
MNYWLIKSEPDDYSWSDLVSDGSVIWSGVRNYQARNYLREMKSGDLVFFYHSRHGLEIVGVARVSTEAYPDPTADHGDWSAVDIEPVKPMTHPVSLSRLKSDVRFAEMPIIRSGRLSVSPVSSSQMNLILEWGGVSLI